jgi:alpha-L-rhamnosidase
MTMRAIGLRCEHREDVPCVDHPAPRFSWALEGGERQIAYRIRVGDLWDSGRVQSAQSVDVEYAGPPLPPGSELEWTVEIWDGEGSEVGGPARFRTGLGAWVAEWIARDAVHDPGVPVPGEFQDAGDDDALVRRLPPCGYFRRRFTVRGVKRATLYATARCV